MVHPAHRMRITLYPMFHIGSPDFYASLSEDLTRFRIFLLEGVRLRGWKGDLYDLVARNLGLVTQRTHLNLPRETERHALDMTEAEFQEEAKRLPLLWWLALRFLRPILWAVSSTEGGRHRLWDSFSKRSYTQRLRDREEPLSELIQTKRDKAMSTRLREFVQDPCRTGKGQAVAVVAGAAHMPALYATLRECGFEKGSVRWFEVLEGLQVPSRGTDGRARQTVV
jgi:hypothetical protein